MRQRVLSTIAALLLCAGALPGATTVLAASPVIAPATGGGLLPMAIDRSVQTRTVDVTSVAAAARGVPTTPPLALPALRDAAPGPASTHPLITTPSPVQATANGDPAVPTTLVSRPGLTNADSVAPGDPYVAVGVSEVVEMVNERIRITDRRGTQQTDITEDAFFGGSGTGFGTGRIIYDSLHQRWLAVRERVDCLTTDGGPVGYLDFARSDSSDPRGSWLVRSLSFGQNLPDLPTLGTSTDKIAFGVDVYTLGSDGSSTSSCLGAGFGTLTGGKLVVLNWAAALGTGSLDFATSISGGTSLTLEWQPAIQEPATSATLFGAYQSDASGVGGSATGFGYLAVTGLVGAGLNPWTTDLSEDFVAAPFAAQGALPTPVEPGPTPISLGVRAGPSGAVWQANRLFVVSAWGATPSGDSTARDTVRVTQLDTTGATFPTAPHEKQDFYVASDALDLYGGGIGLDGNGTLQIVGTASGASQSIASFDVYQRARDALDSVSDLAGLAGGTDDYTGSRWANYVGVAPDPTDSDMAWTGTQIADASGDWTTEITALLPENDVARLYGNDRYTTAVAVSDVFFFTGASNVFIASGANYPDALAGAAVAGPQGAPMLLVPPGSTIPQEVDRELHRLAPTDIYVLGGPASVSLAIQTALASYVGGGTHVHRVAGPDRYGTAAAIAAQFASGTGHHVYVANGTEFPDALAGGPLAAKNGGPLLLLTKDTIPAATATELGLLAPADITILGGPGAVSAAVQTALAAYVGHDGTRVHRIGGTDRYDTARKIVQNGWPTSPEGTIYLASGANFPDALAGAARAGQTGVPLLLLTATSIPAPTAAELAFLDPTFLVLLGGPASVGDPVKVTLEGELP